MKVLSVAQPWASLLAVGAKKYETRSWKTEYRGVIVIHAAKGLSKESRRLMKLNPLTSALGMSLDELPRGMIVAWGQLTGVVRTEDIADLDPFERKMGDFGRGRYAWRIEEIVLQPTPIPYRGRLGLWEAPDLEIDQQGRLTA